MRTSRSSRRASGNGNATLAAARSGTHALGIDYVPGLLEGGRARAVAEGLDVEFRLGDTEQLPVADGSFDAVSGTSRRRAH